MQGSDADGDKLTFGIQNSPGSDVINVRTISDTEANVYLAKELDRETRDEYLLVLTLTDGKLGDGNFITQSLLILVEDVNDNIPIFLPYTPTITIREDASPGIITALEAKDLDEGAYGQVLYYLQVGIHQFLYVLLGSLGSTIEKSILARNHDGQIYWCLMCCPQVKTSSIASLI